MENTMKMRTWKGLLRLRGNISKNLWLLALRAVAAEHLLDPDPNLRADKILFRKC